MLQLPLQDNEFSYQSWHLDMVLRPWSPDQLFCLSWFINGKSCNTSASAFVSFCSSEIPHSTFFWCRNGSISRCLLCFSQSAFAILCAGIFYIFRSFCVISWIRSMTTACSLLMIHLPIFSVLSFPIWFERCLEM